MVIIRLNLLSDHVLGWKVQLQALFEVLCEVGLGLELAREFVSHHAFRLGSRSAHRRLLRLHIL